MIGKRFFIPPIEEDEHCEGHRSLGEYQKFEFECGYEYELPCHYCVFFSQEFVNDDGTIEKYQGKSHPGYSQEQQNSAYLIAFWFKYNYFYWGKSKLDRLKRSLNNV